MNVQRSVKFSYDYVKGSQSTRNRLISSLNKKLVDEMMPYLDDGSFKFDDLKRLYKNLLPENKSVKLQRSWHFRVDGVASYSYDKNYRVVGQVIELPIRRRSKPLDYIIALIHEHTHILDAMVNPKKIALAQKAVNMKSYSSSIYNVLYEQNLYAAEKSSSIVSKAKRLKQLERIIKEVLKSRKNTDKIKILNDMRYDLESEKLAYAEQLKYAKRLSSFGYKVDSCELDDMDKVFWLTEKIQLLKSIIYEYISQERKNHAQKLKNSV